MTLVHILAAGFAMALLLIADKEALSWVRGGKRVLDAGFLRLIHRLTWVALLVLLATGGILFYPMRHFLLGEPLFIMKLLLVGALFVNGILIGRLMGVAALRPYAQLRAAEKARLFATGAASLLGWSGTLALAVILFGR